MLTLLHMCGGTLPLTGAEMQAYPTKPQLAQAIKGQLGTPSGKKKLSRLKRVILRERTDKAASGAALAAANATAAAEKAETARAAVAESLQVGGSLHTSASLALGQRGAAQCIGAKKTLRLH